MANQAIALGVRTPQVDILGGSIQRNAQMINMIAQQRAAERQAALAQQKMQLEQENAALTREEKTRAFRKSDMEYLNNQLPGVKDDISWNRWLGELKKVDPGLSDDLFRATGGRYNPEVVDIIGATAEQYINKTIATPVASFQVSEAGVPQSVVVGGRQPSTKEIPQYRYVPDQPAPSAAAAPQAPSAFDRAFGEGIPAGEEAINAAAQAIANNAGVSDPALKNLTPKEFDEANLRAGKLMLAKPIAAEVNAGAVAPLTVENAPQIVEAALKSGFIDPSHVEQLKQMVGPENGAAVDQWVQQSGLKMQSGLPGMRSAVYRPQQADFGAPVADDGMPFGGPRAPMAQQIGYEPTTTRFKSPTVGPLPGSSQVPIPRVRAEAEAGRPSKGETYDTKKAEAQAANDAKFLEGVNSARKTAMQFLSVIDSMIGDARLNKAGQVEIPRGGRPPHPGFEDVVGATWRPGWRFVPGTAAADFDSYLEQTEGSSFLEAYDTLKGGGPIATAEGEKATRAISRMKRSTSEKEFIKAARELRGIIADSIASADQREAKLKGTAPAGQRRTPVQKGGQKELRYNPATGDFE